jgi:hypothetical protein
MRKKLILEPRFQTSFALAFVRGVVVALALPGVAAFTTLYLLSENAGVTPSQKTILVDGLNGLVPTYLWTVAGLAVAFAVWGLFLSHRFIGPLYRIESWSEKYLLHQNPGPLKLRSGDELSSVAHVLNRIFNKYH